MSEVVRVGHSPDPDDAFMVWALAEGRVATGDLRFELVPRDIETLNRWALEARLDVTALSLHAYPHVQEEYVLLPHGASMGRGYGPVVVAREPLDADALRTVEIAVPGALTTALLVLRLALGEVRVRELAFDRILEEVRDGRAAAGLLIHEGQLTYAREGLALCLDLGAWWLSETGLPLPLGVVAARRGLDRLEDVSSVLARSIEAGLEHRDEALGYALRFARGLEPALAARFVGMYVNELTLDAGDEGRRAIEELLRRAAALGAFPAEPRVEFAPSAVG